MNITSSQLTQSSQSQQMSIGEPENEEASNMIRSEYRLIREKIIGNKS